MVAVRVVEEVWDEVCWGVGRAGGDGRRSGADSDRHESGWSRETAPHAAAHRPGLRGLPSAVGSPAREGHARLRSAPVRYLRGAIVVVGVALAMVLSVHGLSAALGRSATSVSGAGQITVAGHRAQLAAARVVIARPGDSLWSIAVRSGITGDVRPVVDAMEAQLHGQPLQVGQQVVVP